MNEEYPSDEQAECCKCGHTHAEHQDNGSRCKGRVGEPYCSCQKFEPAKVVADVEKHICGTCGVSTSDCDSISANICPSIDGTYPNWQPKPASVVAERSCQNCKWYEARPFTQPFCASPIQGCNQFKNLWQSKPVSVGQDYVVDRYMDFDDQIANHEERIKKLEAKR